ncbi:hypothetical protein GOP47_0010357 [Adiantum capillus-veneris]|uniref:NAC domain-containing protein n=1 Tax=Adiantum capillus-veneris TaxID=13818 RepID=A0A9D4ZIP2_ADICA|nr:hypothetical protein GOP47_0010357 [Adiantum capillus-veneris]
MGALAPGFRFCPTDEELFIYYLRPKAWGKDVHPGTIAEVDIYKFEPWDLPDKSALSTKDPEWYFFSTQDKKYSHTARINRTTSRGYWKATGKDRKVYSGPSIVGLKKTLIYYEGRAPSGRRTNWIMHEYRLDQESEKKEKGMSVSVLCRIRKKGGPGPRNGEQYGAPVWNEGEETDEEAKSGKVSFSNDAGSLEGGNLEGGNAYDLQNQVEGLRSPRRLGPVKVELSEIDSSVNSARATDGASHSLHGTESVSATGGIMACERELNDDLKSTFDIPCFDTAPSMWEDQLAWQHQFSELQDMGTLFDSESLSVLPTLTEFDGHNLQDYVYPSFDEPEILGEMWSLVNNDNYCGLGSKEMAAPQLTSKFDGDYIELNDIEAPPSGFAVRSPLAEKRAAIKGAVQDSLACQGSATRRVRLQVPAPSPPGGRVKNVVTSEHLLATQTPQPRVGMPIHGGSEDIGRLISGSNFTYCNTPHAVESSSRSYLSKHMSTYAVSKFEIAPAQVCYVSLTDNQDGLSEMIKKTKFSTDLSVKELIGYEDGHLEVIKKTDSSTALSTKNSGQASTVKPEIVPVEICYASSIDIQDGSPEVHKKRDSSTTLLSKDEKQIDVDALGKRAVCSLDATASTSLLTEQTNFEGSELEGVASIGSSSRKRDRLRKSLKELKIKLKQTAIGAKLEGMCTKFGDRLFTHGKADDPLFPTEDETSVVNGLKSGLLAILYYLATAALILSCLFWGYHIVTAYASSVSVQ